MPRFLPAVACALAIFATVGCGSSSEKTATEAAPSSGTAGYRAAVNDVFDQVVAARGSYQAAEGDAALRNSASALARADRAGLAALRRLEVPASAEALQNELAKLLEGQAGALREVLAGAKLDTAKLGEAVLITDDAERLVSQINALP